MCSGLRNALCSALSVRFLDTCFTLVSFVFTIACSRFFFGEQVIYSLGLVNAQLFLVSMHDALKPDKEEFKLFRSQVRLGRGEGRKYLRGVGVSAGVGMRGGGGRGERVEGWNRGNGLGIGRGGWEVGGEEVRWCVGFAQDCGDRVASY